MIDRTAARTAAAQVRILCGDVTLDGELAIPPGAGGVVVFAHGSGSSRHSPRNQFVARVIGESGNGTLLFDLLTADEEIEGITSRGNCASTSVCWRAAGFGGRRAPAGASAAAAHRGRIRSCGNWSE